MPKVVDREKKADEIGRSALKVFHALGYHQTRMADIAAAAGVGKGTLYEYFNDKADILQHVFEQYFDAFKKGALEAVAGENGPAAQLEGLIDFSFNHVAEWQDHCSVFVDYFGTTRSNQQGPFSLTDIYADIQKVLTDLIVRGQEEGELKRELDPVAAAEFLVSVFDGVVLHGVFTDRSCGMGALRDTAMALISGGMISTDANSVRAQER